MLESALIRMGCGLLLLGLSLPAPGDDATSMSSIFLVARRNMPDPFFRDSVVLVTHKAGAGPLGVIVNRPLQVPLASVVPDLERSPQREEKIFFGGPVSVDELTVVFRSTSPPAGAIELLEGVYLGSSREVVLEVLGRENPPNGLRVFAGHAAWSPGQLESEIARGDWHLLRADAAAIFALKPEDLWRELERRASAKKVRHTVSSRLLQVDTRGVRSN